MKSCVITKKMTRFLSNWLNLFILRRTKFLNLGAIFFIPQMLLGQLATKFFWGCMGNLGIFVNFIFIREKKESIELTYSVVWLLSINCRRYLVATRCATLQNLRINVLLFVIVIHKLILISLSFLIMSFSGSTVCIIYAKHWAWKPLHWLFWVNEPGKRERVLVSAMLVVSFEALNIITRGPVRNF